MTNDAQMNIRPICPDDADAVAELVAQLGYERTREQVLRWVYDLGSRPEQACFVAELKGEVVAWIDVSLEHHLQSDVFGLIGGLVVKDGVRGAGFARAWVLMTLSRVRPRARCAFTALTVRSSMAAISSRDWSSTSLRITTLRCTAGSSTNRDTAVSTASRRISTSTGSGFAGSATS